MEVERETIERKQLAISTAQVSFRNVVSGIK